MNAQDGHKQNWGRPAKPTGATAPWGSNAQDGHKEAWGRTAKPHYPDAEPGSMNGAPPVADEADEYAHVQGMLS